MSCVSQNTSLLSREKRYIERVNITIKDVTIDYEFRNIAHARAVINEIVRFFNEERLHSAINLLRPVDYYRGDPEKLIVERRTKLIQARHRRRMKNLNIKQHSLALIEPENNQNHNLFQRTKSILLS